MIKKKISCPQENCEFDVRIISMIGMHTVAHGIRLRWWSWLLCALEAKPPEDCQIPFRAGKYSYTITAQYTELIIKYSSFALRLKLVEHVWVQDLVSHG